MAFLRKPGTWLLDPESTSDPFLLQKQLDDLEDRIADAIGEVADGSEDPDGEVAIGWDGQGASQQAMSSSVKFASRSQCTVNGTAIGVRVDLDGLGTTTSGAQQLVGQCHSDASTNPSQRLGESAVVTVPYSTDRTIVTIPFSVPFAVQAGAFYWPGFFGGPSGGVARYGYTDEVGGSYRFISDTWTNGSSSTWVGEFASQGQGTNINNVTLAVALIVIPEDPLTATIAVLQDDVASLQTSVSELNGQIAAVDNQPATAGTGLVHVVEMDSEGLDNGAVYFGEPFDLADGQPAWISSSADGDQSGTLRLQHGPTDGPYTTRVPGTAGTTADVQLTSRQEQARVYYTHGATPGTVQILRTVGA